MLPEKTLAGTRYQVFREAPDIGYAVNIVCRSFVVEAVEPPVRQRYLALLSVFASLPAGALTFQTAWRASSGRSKVTSSNAV
jgi:hypothetical protein